MKTISTLGRYGFDWVEMLTDFGFVTPPISCFRHAPVCDTWASDVSVGMKVSHVIVSCGHYLVLQLIVIVTGGSRKYGYSTAS